MYDYSEDTATFGDRLAHAREAQGLSAEQLAKRLGVRVAAIENWEHDRSEPRANRLQMLAGMLNVSIIWLLTGQGEGAPSAPRDPAGSAQVHITVRALLDEVRGIRLLSAQATDRLSEIEKRLRELGADA